MRQPYEIPCMPTQLEFQHWDDEKWWADSTGGTSPRMQMVCFCEKLRSDAGS